MIVVEFGKYDSGYVTQYVIDWLSRPAIARITSDVCEMLLFKASGNLNSIPKCANQMIIKGKSRVREQ